MMAEVYIDLVNVGYDGQAVKTDVFNQAFNRGPPNIFFVDIVAWLSSQLVGLCQLESYISPVADAGDLAENSIIFLVEISSLLKELHCPIKRLAKGSIEVKLIESEDKKLAIVYLCRELEASKITAVKKPKVIEPALKIELNESHTARQMREMLISLNFGKPPPNISPQKLFTEVEKKLKIISQPFLPADVIGELLFSGSLTEKQWFQLENLYGEMYKEYKNRRNLLMTRLDVTIKSFLWAESLKNKSHEILTIYNSQRSAIPPDPDVKIYQVLSATADLALIEKTSSASVRKNTKSSVNKVIIGAVPDRGGRPEEQQPPPPEVPSWQNSNSSRGGMRQSNQQNSSNFMKTGERGFQKNQNYETSSRSGYNKERPRSDAGDFIRAGDQSTSQYQPQPVYMPVLHGIQLVNPQSGFGGYTPAGDNFQQYGMSDGMHQQQGGSRTRGRSYQSSDRNYYSNRGSRPFRGQGCGRGRGY